MHDIGLAAWFVLRLVLFFAFKPPALPAADVLLAFLSGFHRDLFAALAETIPLLLWMLARSTIVTLWKGGIEWRGTFYPLEELKRGAV